MSEDVSSVTIQADKGTLVFRVSVVGMLAFCVSYIVLWSDSHNDGRYLPRAEYQKDQQYAEQMEDEKGKELERRLDGEEKWLTNISNNLQQLLQHQGSDERSQGLSESRGYPGRQPAADQ